MKILVVQCNTYDYTVATLIEGLIQLSNIDSTLEFKCVEKANYGISHYGDYTLGNNDELAIKYGKEADYIIVTSNNPTRYDIVNNINNYGKTIFLDGADETELLLPPDKFFLYLKRECKKEYLVKYHNLQPFTFAAENRYFPIPDGSLIQDQDAKNLFEQIWSAKSKNLCCLMSEDAKKPLRSEIKKDLVANFANKDGFVWKSAYGGTTRNIIDTGDRHHDKYFSMLKSAKISVDAWGAGKWTGRFFESLANGCVLFFQPLDDFFYLNPFLVYKDLVFYYNTTELIDKVNYLLDNEDELKDIAQCGFNHLINNHTTLKRVEVLIDTIKGYEKNGNQASEGFVR